MKQTITITRTETVQVEIETPQVLTARTIEELANADAGVSGIGRLAFARSTSHVVTPWQVPKAAAAKRSQKKGR